MRYVMFLSEMADDVPEETRHSIYHEIEQWWGNQVLAGKIVGGEQLQPPTTATTIRFNGDATVVTDGPFIESKEGVGGFGVLDVADLDEAIAIAKTWPARGAVELRPVVSTA